MASPLTRGDEPPAPFGKLSVPLRLQILMSVLAGLEHAHTLDSISAASRWKSCTATSAPTTCS